MPQVVCDGGEEIQAEAVGEEAGFFVVALGLAAEGGVAAMPGGATTTNPPRITDPDTPNASKRPDAVDKRPGY